MPRFSSAGRIVAGIAGTQLNIDCVVPPMFTAVQGGGWSWLNVNEVFGQSNFGGVARLYKYNPTTDTLTLLDPNGANETWAGGNVWAAWLGGPLTSPTTGVRTSIASMGVKLHHGLAFVSFDGQIVLVTNRANDEGIEVYNSSGVRIAALSPPVTPLQFLRLRHNILSYNDANLGWLLYNVISRRHLPFAQRVGANVHRTTSAGASRTVVLEQETLATTDRLFVRLALGSEGYEIATGITHFPDIVEIGSGVFRVVWSLTLGEGPNDLRIGEINLNNGQFRLGMPSPGSPGAINGFVYGPFTTLSKITVQTQIVNQGGGSGLFAVLDHPVTDDKTGDRITVPWAAYLRELDSRITGANAAGNLSGIVQPAQGGTGTTTGLTELNADNLTSGTVPQARKWKEFTITAVGPQNDVDYNDADGLRAEPTAALRITGLVAGVPAQRLLIAAVGAGAVTLANEDVASGAANRIITNIGGDLTLAPGTGMALLAYDGVNERWRVLSFASAALIPLAGRWSPLTNGDPLNPELIYDINGDVIDVWVPN